MEYSSYGPATGPQMPPPLYGDSGAWAAAGPAINAPPRTLWEAIKQLPQQYWRVLTKPGAATFAWEMVKARWDIIWVQLLGLALLQTIFVSLLLLIEFSIMSATFNAAAAQSGTSNPGFFGFLLLPIPLIALMAFLIGIGGFFLGQGITYLLAKAFGGQGDFMTQAYTLLLFQVPIGIVSLLLSLIPFVGSLGSFAASVYSIVLQIFALMAVHRLSGGKATAVVLIPVGVGLLLFILFFVAFFFLLFSAISTIPPSP
jgi:Yip1 domain